MNTACSQRLLEANCNRYPGRSRTPGRSSPLHSSYRWHTTTTCISDIWKTTFPIISVYSWGKNQC